MCNLTHNKQYSYLQLYKNWQTAVITGAFFCRPDEFVCNNTLCKLHSWVCDGEDDCGDNSDEDAELCGKKSDSDAKPTALVVNSYSINLLYIFYSIKAVIIQSNTGLLNKIRQWNFSDETSAAEIACAI